MRRKKSADPDDAESVFNAPPVSKLDRVVVLHPITPAGYALIVINFILGAFALVPPLLWLMASDNAEFFHRSVWSEFWRLAFPNIYVGVLLTIMTLLTAMTGAAATFVTLRTRGIADAATDLAFQGACMMVAAGVFHGTVEGSGGGGKFGGGGATGSW